ncbi:MAG: sigma-70 family RNA polymerase sigma factor [Caulobacteraceae bacterium]|nr:sigma-70 family RNA polymerase sigma factor [Caulobacteraceae bacterium]
MNIEDNILIKNIQQKNDEESLKTLVQRHSPLCHSLYKKYSAPMSASGIYVQDIIDQKDYIVYKSAMTFDPCKNSKFSTWLYNQVRYQCLNCINENSHYINLEQDKLNYLIEKNTYQPKDFKNLNDYIFNIIDSCSDERVKKIFTMRYLNNSSKKMSWNKIAKRLKISTQTAINIHNKTLKLLKNKIKSKNYFDKI